MTNYAYRYIILNVDSETRMTYIISYGTMGLREVVFFKDDLMFFKDVKPLVKHISYVDTLLKYLCGSSRFVNQIDCR